MNYGYVIKKVSFFSVETNNIILTKIFRHFCFAPFHSYIHPYKRLAMASITTITNVDGSGNNNDGNDDNDNSIAYAYFIKVSFVVKVL